jgi:hypothetical protein
VKERESIPDTEGRGFLLPHAPKFETSK